jgi:hypothetical protein
MDISQLNEDQKRQLLMMSLIQQHQQIAMIGLGKLKNPATDQISRDLGSAKFAIDTLEAIEFYTEGKLTEELKGFLTQTLTTLRLNYADESSKAEEPSSNGSGDESDAG